MRAVWILPDEQIWSFLLQAIDTPGSYHGSPARKTAGAARVPREREMERERQRESEREPNALEKKREREGGGDKVECHSGQHKAVSYAAEPIQ